MLLGGDFFVATAAMEGDTIIGGIAAHAHLAEH